MNLRSFSLALILSCGLSAGFAAEAKKHIALINPDATPAAVNLYNFLQDVGGKYTLSGQHNFVGKGSQFTEQLEAIIGRTPVVWGSDFSFAIKGKNAQKFQHAGPANLPAIDLKQREEMRAEMKRRNLSGPPPDELRPKVELLDITLAQARASSIAEAKLRHAKGQIITLMSHGAFPTDEIPCVGESVWAEGHLPTDAQWDEMLTDGTPLNQAWKERVDEIAGYLKDLQASNIPVLWRPYHEMNGEWFWWGHKTGERGFKRLWIAMYERYTKLHHLNNLIWVWDANSPRTEETGERHIPYTDCFPGAEYVDVLATDIYRGFTPSHYTELKALANGKPVAIGECGALPSLDVLNQQSDWTWFMPWGWILFTENKPDRIKEVYNSDRVLTLDEISVDQDGKYSVK